MNSFLKTVFVFTVGIAVLNVFILTLLQATEKDPVCLQKNNEASVLLVIEGLRKAHPNASEICIVVAANIAVNNYEDVQHLMVAHGRCATKLLGLRITKDML